MYNCKTIENVGNSTVIIRKVQKPSQQVFSLIFAPLWFLFLALLPDLPEHRNIEVVVERITPLYEKRFWINDKPEIMADTIISIKEN